MFRLPLLQLLCDAQLRGTYALVWNLLMRCACYEKDDERLTESSEASVYVAISRQTTRRLVYG